MLKRLFLLPIAVSFINVAYAADLPVEPPPLMPPSAFSWTGLYIGGHVGYAWGQTSNFAPTAGLASTSYPQSPLGGAQIGVNYQIQQFVFGFEADVDGTGYSKSNTIAGLGNFIATDIPIEGSVRARGGVTWDHLLLYGTAGAAFAESQTTFNPPLGIGRFSNSVFGWTAGGGAEYAITNNWSVRVEYRYTAFDGYTVPASTPTGIRHNDYENIATLGFNYKFSFSPPPVPIVTKY